MERTLPDVRQVALPDTRGSAAPTQSNTQAGYVTHACMHAHGNTGVTTCLKVHGWMMNMQVVVKVTAEWGGEGDKR